MPYTEPNMKTSIDIPEELLEQASALAREQGTTLASLVERALRRLVEECAGGRRGFALRAASVGGEGLNEDIPEGDWKAIRDRVYASISSPRDVE